MYLVLIASLLVASALAMTLERRGRLATPALKQRSEAKRETAFLAQYGQGTCTVLISLIVLRLDGVGPAILVGSSVIAASVFAYVVKRLFSRVRPGRGRDGIEPGAFMGFRWRRGGGWCESFPSSHSAAALAITPVLAFLYPPIAIIVWPLGFITALLRWLLDAHWLSDVMAGCALGIASAWLIIALLWPALGL